MRLTSQTASCYVAHTLGLTQTSNTLSPHPDGGMMGSVSWAVPDGLLRRESETPCGKNAGTIIEYCVTRGPHQGRVVTWYTGCPTDQPALTWALRTTDRAVRVDHSAAMLAGRRTYSAWIADGDGVTFAVVTVEFDQNDPNPTSIGGHRVNPSGSRIAYGACEGGMPASEAVTELGLKAIKEDALVQASLARWRAKATR